MTPKPKRNRFSQKHYRDGQTLSASLRQFQQEYPRFAEQLESCIELVTADAARTRASDRDRVLKALADWPIGLNAREIVEETGLSNWDAREILYDLFRAGKIELTPKPPPGIPDVLPNKHWKQPRLYRLKKR